MIIKEALSEYALSMDRKFSHDRTQTVGASEIGMCARRVHWTKKNGPVDDGYEKSWGAHFRGTMMETQFWGPAIEAKYGKSLLFSGGRQKTLQKGYLSATPDALLTDQPRNLLQGLGVPDMGSDCVLLECKTIDPRVNLTREKDANHFQVQVQLGLVRELTDHKPEYALISYTDASFWDEIDEFPVKFDEAIYETAHGRATKILTADRGEELKPEGWIAGGAECEYCPFTKACGIVRRSVPEREAAADPQFSAEVADLCRDVLAAEAEIKSLESEANEVRQEIKDRLREKSVRRIPGVVTWSSVKGRQSYDMKNLRVAAAAAGVDVESYSKTGDPTDRLQISVGGSPSSE